MFKPKKQNVYVYFFRGVLVFKLTRKYLTWGNMSQDVNLRNWRSVLPAVDHVDYLMIRVKSYKPRAIKVIF